MKALRFLLIIVCAYFLASCVSTKQADSNSNGEKNYINGHKRICKILQTTSILTISVLTVR